MKLLSSQQFLVIYSGLLTVVFAVSMLSGFAVSPKGATFDHIDVQRINIVGPNGRTQMVISNRQDMPEAIIDGKTFHSHGRHQNAGLIFYNGEGDEDGGLTFGGQKTPNGYSASGDLLFDQYKQDQTVGIQYEDENEKRTAGFYVWDRPNTDIAKVMEQKVLPVTRMATGPAKTAALKKLKEQGLLGASRVFVGKAADKAAKVVLCDAKGHPRLTLTVTASGQASMNFLNDNGRIVYTVKPPTGN